MIRGILLEMLYNSSFISRKQLMEYGIWDQLRIDFGREWYLMLYVQEQLAHLRTNTTKHPHLQSSSKLVQ